MKKGMRLRSLIEQKGKSMALFSPDFGSRGLSVKTDTRFINHF